MFEVGDFLMYGKTGVCQLKGISKEAVLDKREVAYYVLQPVFKNCSAVLKVPVGNEKVNIRPLASKDQILAYMEEIASSEPVWNDNDRSRFAEYNESLSSGSCLEWLDLIRQVYQKKKQGIGTDKKVSPRDLGISKEAKRLLHEELSVALDIPIADVEKYLKQRFSQ